MTQPNMPRQAGFRLEITRAGWIIMGVFFLLWLGLVLFSWVIPTDASRVTLDLMIGPPGFEVPTPTTVETWTALMLHPVGSAGIDGSPGFHAWQLVSAPLLYPPLGLSNLLLGCLGLMFFAAPVERLLGVAGLLQVWFVACAGGVAGAILVGLAFAVPPVFGFAPAVIAIMLIHCMMTPEASVPFFFVLHVKMKWVAVGIATFVLIRALGVMGQGDFAADGRHYVLPYELVGAAAGYFFWRSGADLDPRRIFKRRRARRNLRLAVDRLVNKSADEDDPVFH